MIVNGIRYARKCNECGEGMNEGYVIDGGCEHYCSDACLHKHVSPDEFEDLHDDGDGDSYWTEWEDQNDWDDDDEEEEALRVATTRDYQALAQERKRREKMVRDAAPDLLAALLPLVEASPVGGGMIRFDGDQLQAAIDAIAKAQGV